MVVIFLLRQALHGIVLQNNGLSTKCMHRATAHLSRHTTMPYTLNVSRVGLLLHLLIRKSIKMRFESGELLRVKHVGLLPSAAPSMKAQY